MKGIIFNIVEEVVVDQFGQSTWEALLDATGSSGAYTSLGSYPDAELAALVDAAAQATGQDPRTVLHWIGAQALPKLQQRFPVFFTAADDARTFILSVNTIIHPEVRKLYSGAGCPHFHFVETPETLTLGYSSPRKMCDLAHGFVDGVATYYGEQVAVTQPSCMHDGAPSCQLVISWS